MDKFKFADKLAASKKSHDEYDTILRSLNKDMRTPSELEGNLVDMAFLAAKGYLSYQKYPGDNNMFGVRLTEQGCVFITEGGFKEQDRLAEEKNTEIELTKMVALRSIRISTISMWISFAATLITLGALIYSITHPS